jgi:small subunit ribosomal protein S11
MGRTKTKTIGLEEQQEVKEKFPSPSPAKSKLSTSIHTARFYIKANQNNTLISFTDDSGNVLLQSSSGRAGFKNTKKGTPYAGAKAMEFLLSKLNKFAPKEVKVFIKGIGPGRESAMRALFNSNLNIVSMEDQTPIPFGGPTVRKSRRV